MPWHCTALSFLRLCHQSASLFLPRSDLGPQSFAMMRRLLLLLAAICCTTLRAEPAGKKLPCPPQISSSGAECSAREEWFEDQLVDHLTWNNTRIWRQRYLISDTWFDKEQGPIFFYGKTHRRATISCKTFPGAGAAHFSFILSSFLWYLKVHRQS